MAETSYGDYRDPYHLTYNYYQHQHQQQTFSQIPLTPDYLNSPTSPTGSGPPSYIPFHTSPSPHHSQPSAEYWYPQYSSHYGHLSPTPTSPTYHFPLYPPYSSSSGTSRSGLPEIPDYLSARGYYSTSLTRPQFDLRQQPSARPRVRRASQRAVAELHSMRLSELPESDRSCNICMDPYVELKHSNDQAKKEHALRMPCGHVFGSYCIKQWLLAHNTCPACRMELDYVEFEEEESATRSRPSRRTTSLSSHEAIVNDLFGEPYRDPTAFRSRSPHHQRPHSYFNSHEEPSYGTTSNARPTLRRSQTSMGQGSGHTSRYPFARPPSPGLARHPSQARMGGMKEAPYMRPGSSSSSAAATTQSEPARGASGFYSTPGRSSTFRRPDLKCALETMRLCVMNEHGDLDEERPHNRLVRLDCGHGYHSDCLVTAMKTANQSFDPNSRLLFCPRCRKHMGRRGGE